MRKRLAALVTTVTTLAAVAGMSSVPAGAQAVTDQSFAGYGSGATLSINVLGVLGLQTLNVQAASAGQSMNSKGLPGSGLNNEMGYVIQPGGISDKQAYGRGTGLEVGLLTSNPNPDPNQILLSGLAQASAQPNSDLVVKQIGPISLGSVAYANLLRGQAQATFDPNTCVVGKPFTFGEGEAAGLQLVGTATSANQPLNNPLIGAGLPVNSTDPRNASRTRSVTYLQPNGDGTFAVVSETRQTIAPLSLLGGAITIELLGEWALKAIATGKPGGASIQYAPVGAGPTTNVAVITIGSSVTQITTQQLFGPGGFSTAPILGALSSLLNLSIGTPARQLGGTGAPQLAADGTSASAAVDVVKVGLLQIAGVLNGADIRMGHMEAAAVAPAGGVKCNLPVNKSAQPNPVVAGQPFTITISIPSDTAQFQALFGCDLVDIKAVDVHSVVNGNASFVLDSADNGGTVSSDGTTVTFANVGTYHIGDPPIQLHVQGHIPGSSGAGTIQDIATVTASLGNCNGTTGGQDIVGQGVSGGLVQGTFTLQTDVTRSGVLAATGTNDGRLLVFGGAFLLLALGVRRRLRKPTDAPSTTA